MSDINDLNSSEPLDEPFDIPPMSRSQAEMICKMHATLVQHGPMTQTNLGKLLDVSQPTISTHCRDFAMYFRRALATGLVEVIDIELPENVTRVANGEIPAVMPGRRSGPTVSTDKLILAELQKIYNELRTQTDAGIHRKAGAARRYGNHPIESTEPPKEKKTDKENPASTSDNGNAPVIPGFKFLTRDLYEQWHEATTLWLTSGESNHANMSAWMKFINTRFNLQDATTPQLLSLLFRVCYEIQNKRADDLAEWWGRSTKRIADAKRSDTKDSGI